MKVLQIGKYYPPRMGGIETHLQVLSEGLHDKVDLDVLVSNSSSHSVRNYVRGVNVERLATPLTLASAPISPGLISKIRNTDADVVHVHLPNPLAVLACLAAPKRVRFVATYHSDTVRQKFLGAAFEPLLHRFLESCNAIVATSPAYKATSPVLAKHQDRSHVVPYGVALEAFAERNDDAVQSIHERFGERLVIAVGRLVYYKGFEVLLSAAADIDAKILIIGDGPLRESLQRAIAQSNIADRVYLLGEVQNADLPAYYHAAQVFVLPSIARSEAFGIVQIEAMASGLPVVNTALDSGVPYVSLNGYTGLTVPPCNPAELAAAVNTLLSDHRLRASYGDAARERAFREFNVTTMVDRILTIYNQ